MVVDRSRLVGDVSSAAYGSDDIVEVTVVIPTVGRARLVIPTPEEILCLKAWLAVSLNQTRDYLDIAALADTIGLDSAAVVLGAIDACYSGLNRRPEAVAA
jgi:hypothetical protein